ncbi:MAG TPA: hypothetical protein VFE60_05350 [Roseiarcus sp.]|nr:hypothetical protein [Roseiarcus sp.]
MLDSLSDDAINALTVEIKNANPFLDDAGIIRILTQRVAAGDVGKAVSDDDLLALADYERRLNPSLSDREVHARVARSSAVRADRREFRGEMEAARRAEMMGKRDDALDALTAKAADLCKADPSMTKEMAFARAYSDPRNRELAKAERRANRPEAPRDAYLAVPVVFSYRCRAVLLKVKANGILNLAEAAARLPSLLQPKKPLSTRRWRPRAR